MKILVGSNRIGPAAVFLPDGTHAVAPASEALIAPLLSQAAARGSKATFEEHAQRLTDSAPYAGYWQVLDVPDDISAPQALHYARYRSVNELFHETG